MAVLLGIAVLYTASGSFGLTLAHTHRNATLIWPPSGLALAALVTFGRRVWPGVLIGAAVTNALIHTAAGPLLAISIGNTLEAVVGAYLLLRVAHIDTAFARLRDVLAFLALGALLSTTVSATIGVGALYLAGSVPAGSFYAVWRIWWLGDAGGVAIVAPLLLVGLHGRPRWASIARRAEAWVALVVLTFLVTAAFGGIFRDAWKAHLGALLLFSVIVWIGLRLGPRGAVSASFVASVVAVVGTAADTGPFAGVPAESSLLLLWAYLFALGTVAMTLAAAVAEREDADEARRAGEAERAKLAVQVQHVQRLESLGLLAGGVAHDLNNLLVPIRGNAELLRTDDRFEPDDRRDMLGQIELASVQAGELCRQLLTYAGRSKPRNERIDLRALVEEMAPLLRTSASGVGLHVVADEVPAVEGDRTQLGQVLMNLVLNAAEASDDSGGSIEVCLEVREVTLPYLRDTFLHSDAPAGSYVVLRVSDQGKGMSRETMVRIFDPFFTTKDNSRGLGMASVLGIVRAHRGAIKVESSPGNGTTFNVLFPVARSEKEPGPRSEPAPDKEQIGGAVLLADDDVQVQRVARKVLEGEGFDVLLANDGVEALEIFREHRNEIAVVLFDVSMPRLSGTDALARIYQEKPGFPAVLMSGYDAGRADHSGTPFVQKPFEARGLVEALREAVRGGRRHDAEREGST